MSNHHFIITLFFYFFQFSVFYYHISYNSFHIMCFNHILVRENYLLAIKLWRIQLSFKQLRKYFKKMFQIYQLIEAKATHINSLMGQIKMSLLSYYTLARCWPIFVVSSILCSKLFLKCSAIDVSQYSLRYSSKFLSTNYKLFLADRHSEVIKQILLQFHVDLTRQNS